MVSIIESFLLISERMGGRRGVGSLLPSFSGRLPSFTGFFFSEQSFSELSMLLSIGR